MWLRCSKGEALPRMTKGRKWILYDCCDIYMCKYTQPNSGKWYKSKSIDPIEIVLTNFDSHCKTLWVIMIKG